MSESKQMTAQQSFEEKIKDRLRSDIGDLIPDEMLQEMIKRSIEDFFFKDTDHVVSSGWGSSTKEKRPGWFHNSVKKRLERRLDRMVGKYIDSQGERMMKLIEDEFVREAPRIIMAAFIRTIVDIPQGFAQAGIHDLEQRIRERRL